ncbi:hypothetical protein F5X96DRAFT_684288 [Biscogniauxia mediterranea]|nr:hypothetical protein F5X96DRAFT_684288 [Biscogniauxia mediterranea]
MITYPSSCHEPREVGSAVQVQPTFYDHTITIFITIVTITILTIIIITILTIVTITILTIFTTNSTRNNNSITTKKQNHIWNQNQNTDTAIRCRTTATRGNTPRLPAKIPSLTDITPSASPTQDVQSGCEAFERMLLWTSSCYPYMASLSWNESCRRITLNPGPSRAFEMFVTCSQSRWHLTRPALSPLQRLNPPVPGFGPAPGSAHGPSVQGGNPEWRADVFWHSFVHLIQSIFDLPLMELTSRGGQPGVARGRVLAQLRAPHPEHIRLAVDGADVQGDNPE